MSEIAVTDALADHFKRTWAMLREAIERFPEETWLDGEDQRMLPPRIAYHILMSADRYTWAGPANDYLSQRKFQLDWERSALESLPSRRETLGHFQAMESRTLDWLDAHGDEGLTTAQPTFPWTGANALAQSLYLLRHLQHHLAELNVELRRRGIYCGGWR